MTRPVTTYYDTLQVARSASDGVIRAAYRSLSQRYHPDKHTDKLQWANQMMLRLNEAYGVLSDPERRAAYDRRLAEHEATRQSEPVRQDRGTHPSSGVTASLEAESKLFSKKLDLDAEKGLLMSVHNISVHKYRGFIVEGFAKRRSDGMYESTGRVRKEDKTLLESEVLGLYKQRDDARRDALFWG